MPGEGHDVQADEEEEQGEPGCGDVSQVAGLALVDLRADHVRHLVERATAGQRDEHHEQPDDDVRAHGRSRDPQVAAAQPGAQATAALPRDPALGAVPEVEAGDHDQVEQQQQPLDVGQPVDGLGLLRRDEERALAAAQARAPERVEGVAGLGEVGDRVEQG